MSSNSELNNLIQQALEVPIEKMDELCAGDAPLAEVCASEFFWKERVRKDFPSYDVEITTILTYRDYYMMLWKLWNTTNRGKYLLSNPAPKFPSSSSNVTLIYPVPRFDAIENSIVGDVEIYYISNKDLYVAAFSDRSLVTGASLPPIANTTLLSPRTLRGDELDMVEYYLNKKPYAGFYVIKKGAYTQFIADAQAAGYMQMSSTKLNNFEKDFYIINRVKGKVPVERIKRSARANKIVEEPDLSTQFSTVKRQQPVQQKKIKKLFGFLQSS